MTPGSVARRYARALYELAREDGGVEQIGEGLAEVAAVVAELDAGELVAGALDVELRRKLGEALARPFGPESTLGRFLRLVAQRDRLEQLPGIHYWYLRRLDDDAGRVRAAITTPAPLGDGDLDAVVSAFERLAGRQIVPELAEEPELIGGAVVELEGRVYDGSLRTRLARLAAKMAGGER